MMKINELPNESSISTIRGWPFKLVTSCCALLLLLLVIPPMLSGEWVVGFGWLGALLIFLVLAPIVWTIGDRFRRFTRPDSYFAADGMDAFGKKIYWRVGPQQTAIYFLLFVVYFSGNSIIPKVSAKNSNTVGSIDEMRLKNEGASGVEKRSISDSGKNAEKNDFVAVQSSAIDPLNSLSNNSVPPAPAPAPAPAPSADAAISSPQSVWAPSFDCMKASSFSEKAICTDSLLGKLDGVLSQNYKFLLASDVGEVGMSDLKVSQKKWLIDRDQCKNNQCLIDIYRNRIEEICDHSVVSGVRPICVRSDGIL